VSCFGDASGSVSVTGSGGTAPYSYLWSNGATTQNISGVVAGNYSVVVTDAKGCTVTLNNLIINQPTAVPSIAVDSKQDVNCFGSANGSITVTVSGGTGAYTYSWSNGATTEDLTGVTAGNYTLTVIDANGCISTGAAITIAQPAAPLAVITTKTDINCFGSTTGSVSYTITGGTAPYTYSYSYNGGSSSPSATVSASSGTIPGLAAGTYRLIITDSKGCVQAVEVIVEQPMAALSFTAGQIINVSCFGDASGSVSVIGSGGTAPYTYLWSNGATTQNIRGVPATTYSLVVTDANGCTFSLNNLVVAQPVAKLTSIINNQINVLCFGDNTGTVTVQAQGGTSPYSYSTKGTVNNTGIFSNLVANIYIIRVTDSKGCFTDVSVDISQPAAYLSGKIISQTNILCYGESTGLLTAQGEGGTLPYSYLLNGITNNTGIFSGLATGNYSIRITDANGCVANVNTMIAQPASSLSGSIVTQSNVSCYGEASGSVNVQGVGGTSPYTYSVNGTRNTSGIFTNLIAGSYIVKILDSQGCSFDVPTIINQPTMALDGSIKSQVNVNCFGESNGSASVQGIGGNLPYTYSINGISNTTGIFSNLNANNYIVKITDGKECSVNIPVTISQPAPLKGVVNIQSNVSCFGENTGSVTVTAEGGTSPYTYSANGINNTTGIFTNLVSKSYAILVSDARNCTVSMPVTISQPNSAISISFVKTDINCFGGNNGKIDLSVTGGTAPFKYSWSNKEIVEDLNSLIAGTYTVTVTDANGCKAIKIITIDQPAEILSIAHTKINVSCVGANNGTINLTVTGGTQPYSFIWSDDKKTEDITDLAPGSYKVNVVDAKNCTATSTIVITEPSSALSVTLTAKPTVCKNSNDGSIAGLISGGVPPYTISWKNKSYTTASITSLSPGIYEIIVTDANNCSVTTSAEVIAKICPPAAINDKYKTLQDEAIPGNVSLNDSDGQGEALTFTMKTQVKNGTIRFSSDGKFVYTPNKGYWGVETFTYEVCNTSGLCVTANAIIDVVPFTIVSLTPEISNVREGRKGAVTAKLMRAYKDDVIITISYSGKAIKDKDYLLLDQSQRIRIPKGSTTTTEKITIAALTDDLQEGDEDVILNISSTSDTLVRIGNGAVVIINDIYPPDTQPALPVKRDFPQNPDITPDPLLSPNGDGQGNEFFKIDNILSFPDNEVTIFNRWGNEIFYIKGYNESDQVFKGYANKGLMTNTSTPLPDGVYYFLITTNRVVDGITVSRLNKGYIILKR
ncbi:MAG TPA: gliding motility-associated C-terminal domain-containing protein, partial [Sphingobacteriaceae bacterium]|nr:gliding motility-associated C-terminal domain-containing protein [Sphingobacteriaceae bacterium]